MALAFPSSPTIGDQYVSPTGVLYLWDGSWTTSGDTQASNPFENVFLYRSIYTHGYVSGGYKNGSPWKNTNRTDHATDITTNLGDRLDYAAGYVHGGHSDYNFYVYGVTDSFQAGSTYTTSVAMATETSRLHNSAWDLKTSRYYQPTVFMNSNLTMVYITGGAGNGSTDKHNTVTEVMYAAGTAPSRAGAGSHSGGCYGEHKGWYHGYYTTSEVLTYATDTWSNWGEFTGTDGVNKGHSTKHGHGYMHPGNNVSTNIYYKFSDSTGVITNTSISDPNGACGEENHETGQNHGYYLGQYNGAQNNVTTKFNYLTDTCTAMGSDTQPKGHDGMSSGANASASRYMLGL